MPLDPSNLYAGIVYDALRLMDLKDDEFLLDGSIRPIDPGSWCFGPVFTNRGRPVHPGEDYKAIDAIRLEMYRAVKPGQILVLEARDMYCAHSGDITSLIYSKLGAAGFITDGVVRDSRRIRELGFPCFVRDTNPIDALSYWGIVEYGTPVTLPGRGRDLTISPDDWLYADADGVLLIRKEWLPRFTELVETHTAREETCRQAIEKVERPEDVFSVVKGLFDRHGRW